ncbi:MAG: hypothetical protein Q7S33_02470 [Nanoarchaeota archaeon]|nr:hypothetical protein [Nanoarchaeota archaeon]
MTCLISAFICLLAAIVLLALLWPIFWAIFKITLGVFIIAIIWKWLMKRTKDKPTTPTPPTNPAM